MTRRRDEDSDVVLRRWLLESQVAELEIKMRALRAEYDELRKTVVELRERDRV